MKGSGLMNSGKGTPGEVQIVEGTATISNGKLWLPYPETAHALIKLAQEHGWGFDDGLPGEGLCRMDSENVPFIRILLGRELGENGYDPQGVSPGIQFHLIWRMPHPVRDSRKRSWIRGDMFVKTTIQPEWRKLFVVKDVRMTIVQNSVPSGGYALV